jgi:hypothetical protein
VQLIVTELVGNAARHARTPIDLVLRRSASYLHVAVIDGDPRPARLCSPSAREETGGRGLVLVNALAVAWGCSPTLGGKSTWATVSDRRARTG